MSARDPSAAIKYDFRRSMGLDRDSMRSLRIVLDAFARLSGNTLTASLAGLRSAVRVHLDEVSQKPWSDIVESLTPFMCVVQIEMHPLEGQAILLLPFEFAVVLFELRMGGAVASDIQPRSLTEIELKVLTPLFESMLSELESTFSPIISIKVEVVRTASGSGVIGLGNSPGTWLVADLDARLAEERSYQFSLCIPVSMMRSVVDAMAESQARSRPEEAEKAKVLANVLSLPMPIAVRFAPLMLSAADLADIQAGDVIPLHHDTTQPMELIVGDMPFLRVIPTTAQRRLAVTVIDDVTTRNPGGLSRLQARGGIPGDTRPPAQAAMATAIGAAPHEDLML